MRRIAAAALFVSLLAGCSSSPAPATAEATAQPSPTPAFRAADTYDGAQRLVGGLNESGIACINYDGIDNPIGALERGSCYVGTEEVVASVYASHDDVESDVVKKVQLLAGSSDVNMVTGGNWALSCDSQTLCTDISQRFGGELHHVPAE
jgi:PBP1b-binding outer membrane lipoprotein LpoB